MSMPQKAKLWPRSLVTTSLSSLSLLLKNPRKTHIHSPIPLPFLLTIHVLYPPSADASACFFVNKLWKQSFYSATFPTFKYSNPCLRSSVIGVKDVMIQNLYHTENLCPSSTKGILADEPLPVDTHEIFPMSLLLLPTRLPSMYC
jgi:hypothetical protein